MYEIKKVYENISIYNINNFEKQMLKKCKDSLELQSPIWHQNSSKKVSACIYISKRDEYVTGQNIGISKVTGSLCAERSAVAAAISKFPDLEFNEIDNLFVLGDKNPLLPCGVCCEWLYKINPNMSIYAFNSKDNNLIKIKLLHYYGDENTIEGKYYRY